MKPDFDLENEDIPVLAPDGVFLIWMTICRWAMAIGGVGIFLVVLLIIRCMK